MRRPQKLLLLASLLLAGCIGCAQHGAVPEAVPPPQPRPVSLPVALPQAIAGRFSLPRPSSLPGIPNKAKRTSYIEADLLKNGVDFKASLPRFNVAAQSNELAYSPAYNSGPTDTIDKTALATYLFNADGYDRQAQLRTVWSVAPADPDSLWYGFINWKANRWDWYKSPADFKLILPSFDPYLNLAGSLVLVVLRIGNDPSTLTSLRLGAPLPTAVLKANTVQGEPPLPVTFDASESSAAEGSIVKYEFDKGTGTQVDKGATPTFDTTYSANGIHNASVRVTDSQGGQATAQLEIRVTGPWVHTYSRGFYDEVYGLTIDSAGNIYACGISDAPGGSSSGAVWKYDAFGNLIWIRGTSSDSNAQFKRCALDGEGNLILCGYEQLSGDQYRGILQKWTPDGQAIWSRAFAGVPIASLDEVMVNGTEIYAVGDRENAAQDTLLIGMRVGPDGTLRWCRSWNVAAGFNSAAYCGALRTGAQVGSTELLAGGYTGPFIEDPPSFKPSPVLIGWDEDGNLIRSWRIGDGSYNGYIYSLRVSGSLLFNTRYVALGSHFAGSGYQTFLFQSKLDGSGDGGALYGQQAYSVVPSDMCKVPSVSGWLTSGTLSTSANVYGSLIGLDLSGTHGPEFNWDSSDKGETYFDALRPAAGGGVVLGGRLLTTDINGVRGDLSGTSIAFDAAWENVSGSSDDAHITFVNADGGTIDLSGGSTDTAVPASVAMVRYETLAAN